MDQTYTEEFARLALELHEQPGVPETIEVVLGFALRAVAADAASVLLLPSGKRGSAVELTEVTGGKAAQADQLQLECGEGPCIAASPEAGSIIVHDALTDQRWPTWSKRIAAELGIRSVLSVRLHTSSTVIGALNLYDAEPHRFDRDDDAVAHVLARHAAIALARSRHEASLWEAIDARKLIGQAQGILMERFGLDDEQAFAVLRRYSQDNNIKLRVVAERLISTRQLPDPAASESCASSARAD
jgi:GAF domain-containing protein